MGQPAFPVEALVLLDSHRLIAENVGQITFPFESHSYDEVF